MYAICDTADRETEEAWEAAGAVIFDSGMQYGGTFAQNIASKFSEATEQGRDALIASGLVLFVITLLVNGAARLIIARRKEYSGANA